MLEELLVSKGSVKINHKSVNLLHHKNSCPCNKVTHFLQHGNNVWKEKYDLLILSWVVECFLLFLTRTGVVTRLRVGPFPRKALFLQNGLVECPKSWWAVKRGTEQRLGQWCEFPESFIWHLKNIPCNGRIKWRGYTRITSMKAYKIAGNKIFLVAVWCWDWEYTTYRVVFLTGPP